MSGLIRVAGGQPPAAAAGAQSRSVGYEGTALTWHDIDALPPLPSDAVAVAVCGRRAVRLKSGSFAQRATAFATGTSGVLVIDVARDLAKRTDGKMSPAGPWRVEAQVKITSTKPVQMRTGQVPNDYATDDTPASGASTRSKDPYAGEAGRAMGILPGVVQRGLVQAVASPSRFMGLSLGYSRASGPVTREEVHLLRYDATTAVALHATRGGDVPDGLDATESLRFVQEQAWTLTQFTYTPLARQDISALSGSARLELEG